MNFYLLSDITFDLVIKQINEHDKIINNYNYTEDIIASLLSIQNKLEDVDTLIIHFDSFFHKYKEEYIVDIIQQIENISKKIKGNVLISNNIFNGSNISNLKKNIGQNEQIILNINHQLEHLLNRSNVYFYDFKKLLTNIGLKNSYNYNMGFLYQMPYTKELISQLATEIKNYINFLSMPEKKAIFIDCDNTLWNGILGEDGLNNIQCNKNANGIIFYHFQEFLKDRKKEGFILGLCSKNNESDVKDAFGKLNMPLNWDDFIIKKINWNNKVDNLLEAAKELNIGVSSFIFIDDNEFEIQSVNAIIPEIKTIHFVNNYQNFLSISDDFAFKKKFFTVEDLVKTNLYQSEILRNNEKTNIDSFEDYITSLNIKLDILINNDNSLERLSQLTEKTNQFNFNKKPFTIDQLKQFINDGNIIYELKVSDKFGDYGIVGLILIEVKNNKKAVMINYLMSCRALGRNIENDFYKYMLNDIKNKGLELSGILFAETDKNIPAKTFYNEIKI